MTNGCVIQNNVISGNTQGGIDIGNSAGSGYGGNVINGNAGGTVTGSVAFQIGPNVCNSTATCP